MFTFTILDNGKYQVASAFQIRTSVYPEKPIVTRFCSLWADGDLLILQGFEWDGPSGPAIDTTTFMRASCVHDCIYTLIGSRLLDKSQRGAADREMRVLARRDGMSLWRCWSAWAAVRLFGGRHV